MLQLLLIRKFHLDCLCYHLGLGDRLKSRWLMVCPLFRDIMSYTWNHSFLAACIVCVLMNEFALDSLICSSLMYVIFVAHSVPYHTSSERKGGVLFPFWGQLILHRSYVGSLYMMATVGYSFICQLRCHLNMLIPNSNFTMLPFFILE